MVIKTSFAQMIDHLETILENRMGKSFGPKRQTGEIPVESRKQFGAGVPIGTRMLFQFDEMGHFG